MSKFARKSDGRHATVCKDIPPKSARKVKKEPVPTGKTTHSVSLPIEYEMALQEMYPDISLPLAIRKFIVDNIELPNGNSWEYRLELD